MNTERLEEVREMKQATRAIISFGVMLVLLGLLGCSRTARISGTYITDTPGEYLELKKDGVFYWKEKSEYEFLPSVEETGKWKVEGDEIIFTYPLGIVDRVKIKGNTLIDPDGKTWRKGKR